MALIKCPECKKKVSDQCENCPNCGYPIKSNITVAETETSEKSDLSKGSKIKTLFKKWWFWLAIGIFLVTLVLGTILLINRDTKPKLDKDGNPVFVELTNEVYTNANKYKGYHINIKGQVFQVMGDNGETKGIQIWLDPETCEQNLMIYYSTDVEAKQGDYISCSGYIDSVTKYKNAYDAELQVPLVFSCDLKIATYIDVMAPTLETIIPENLKKESHGYTVSVDKVEFSEKETRVYVSVSNNGKATLYVGDSVIIQNGKQYSSTTNYDADYEEIPYEILKGASSTGIIVFPTINPADFELSFDVHSDDFEEKLGEYIFEIRKENSSTKDTETPIEIITPLNLKQEKYGYSVAIDRIEFYSDETRIHLTVVNNGKTLLYVDSDGSVILQEGKQYNTTHNYNADYAELPYEIIKGATVSGAVSFPQMSSNDFELTIDLHSDDFDEEIEKFVFKISKNPVAPPVTEPVTETRPQTQQPSTEVPITNNNNTPKCELTLSEANINIQCDTFITASVTGDEAYFPNGITLTANYDDSIIEIEWGEWSGWTVSMKIIPIQTGSCNITVYVEEEPSANKTISVNVDALKNSNDDANPTTQPTNPPSNRDEDAIEEARWMAYYDYTATPADIQRRLVSELGFSSEDAWYCVGKVTNALLEGSHYNWIERVEYYVTYELQDYYIQYTWCNNCEEVYGVHEKCPICGNFIPSGYWSTFGYTKEEVISKLKNQGFSDSDIQAGVNNIPSDKFYDESKYKKP